MFPKIIIFALQQIKIFQNHPLSKIRIFWKNIHPWTQDIKLDSNTVTICMESPEAASPLVLGQRSEPAGPRLPLTLKTPRRGIKDQPRKSFRMFNHGQCLRHLLALG